MKIEIFPGVYVFADFLCEEPITEQVTVAPLNPGRQKQDSEPTDKPCPECCQSEACRRNCYCAAHRCGFGERAP